MRLRARQLIGLAAIAVLVAGCATGRAFRRGQDAARVGDWDTAVAYYRQALAEDPDRLEARVALERASQSASLEHLTRARKFEGEGQFVAAAAEYRRVLEFDASNQFAAAKAAEMDKIVREQIEAARPEPEIDKLREQIRREQESAALPLNQPLPVINFSGGTLREILEFIGGAAKVNVIIDPRFPPIDLNQPVSLHLQESTVDDVLRHLSTLYGLFYRTLDGRTILVAKDDPESRQRFEEQAIQTFYLSHSKSVEVGNVLTQILRGADASPSGSVPTIIANESSNTITVRATPDVLRIAERIVHTNDRPKAEVVIEVSILEVDRARAKAHGLDLSQYAVGVTLSPEFEPADTATTPDVFPAQPPPINGGTLGQGITRNDLYLTVPSAMIRFLESDQNTRLIAKPNLRGQEGAKLTLNLGDEVPVPTTTFGAAAGGGIATIPISQFQYRPVGVNLEITPDVTYEGEIVLQLVIESSGQGPNVNVAGQSLPSFTSRKVNTTLRLRDGESNMLAGLLREEERKSLRGLPGLLRVPVIRELFTANDQRIETTDIVMLLTPRIVRTQEITAEDLRPINIGTLQNRGIGEGGPIFGLSAPGQPAPSATGAIPGAPPGGVPTQPVAGAPGVPTTTPVPPANTTQRPVQDLPAPTLDTQVVVAAPPMTAGAPAMVPVSISNASRVARVSLSIAYDPRLLRARQVAQGAFMAQGGQAVSFVPRIDEAAGRIDISISRTGDTTGASGAGLLATIEFTPLMPGDGQLSVSGIAASPEGQQLPLQVVPIPFRIR